MVSEFLDIILDKKNSIGRKAILVTFIVFLLFFVDNVFDFTYKEHISYKLSNLEKIYNLKIAYKNDTTMLAQLHDYEIKIKNSKHYTEKLSSFLSILNFKKEKEQNLPVRHNIFLVLSSSFIPILVLAFCLILFPIGLLFEPKKFFVGWIGVVAISLVATLIISSIAFFIPPILKNYYYNYTIYFLVQILIIILLCVLYRKWRKQ